MGDAFVEQARLQIVAIARAMLDGTTSFIEGAREINRLRQQAEIPDFDPDIVPFRAIDSETDALPFGEVRKLWASAALERLKSEIESSESWARDVGAEACQKLIKRFAPAPH